MAWKMKEYGKKVWLIPDTYMSSVSTGNNVTHEAICVLNTGDRDAELSLTFFYEDKECRNDFKAFCGARRTNHIRMDKLKNDAGESVARDTPYAILVESSVPVVIQYTRLDCSAVENTLMTTIAYSVDE